ncbi:MAG: hypothetical protein AAB472_02710 [Patescibacteria group bacterium]
MVFTSLSDFFSHVLTLFIVFGMSVLHFFVPLPPSCALDVISPKGEQHITSTGTMMLQEGQQIQITWSGMNAKKATVNGVDESPLTGTESFTPTATTTYTYSFESGSHKALCSVEVRVERKPQAVATSTPVVAVQPKPPVVVPVPPPVTPPIVVVPPPVTPPTVPSVPLGPTTLVVWYIPLLSGGTVRAGQTVPVMYLQITNVGSASTIITGFWLTQKGSASPESVVGLSTIDDKGGSRGASEGDSLFTDYVALAPTDAHFEPGQLRLFTIKAKVASDVTSNIGEGITLVVSDVETSATVEGKFPIQGTTWTIAP